MKINPNAPAYPEPPHFTVNPDGGLKPMGEEYGYCREPGLSIRAEFAKAAMQAMITNPYWDDKTYYSIADGAVVVADALISALNAEPEKGDGDE